MKRLMSVVAVASCVCCGFAADGIWTKTGSNTPDTAYLWDAEGNWQGGIVPSAKTDAADFYTTADSSATRWIALPETLDIKGIVFKAVSGELRFIGTNVNLYASGVGTGTSSGSNFARLYADKIVCKASCGFQRTDICGDISSSVSITPGYGMFRHCLDLYATTPGGERINPGLTYALNYAYGSYAIRCPESSATDLKSEWTLAAGSTLAKRVNTANPRHALPVGTTVTAANGALPAGTWLKRIYDDNTIELSAPATDDGAAELTFAAQTSVVRQQLDQINSQAPSGVRLYFSQYRAEDDCELWVRSLGRTAHANNETYRITIGTETEYPGTIVLKKTNALLANVILGSTHLRFEKPDEAGLEAGLYYTPSVRHQDANSVSRLTVTNAALTAKIACFTNLVGSLTKDGAGTLEIGLRNSFTASGALVNTGSIVADGGVLRITGEACGVRTLSIGATGTLEVPAAGFRAENFSCEQGAVLKGGELVLTKFADTSKLTLADGASVKFDVHDGEVLNSLDGINVSSNLPAFWVDALNEKSFAFLGEEEGGKRFITRWSDTRETDPANPSYMFATNTGDVHAKRIVATGAADGGSLTYVMMDNHVTLDPLLMEHLVWSVPLKNIRAVFMVRDPGLGCGQALLGAAAARCSRTSDFRRNAQNGANINAALFHANASALVKEGRHFINGEATTWEGKYPYGHYKDATGAGIEWFRPLMQEVHTTGDCMADCFGALYPDGASAENFNGYDSICECLIYTNELAETERLAVEQYLMKKWMDAKVSYDRFALAPDRTESFVLSGTAAFGLEGRADVDNVSGSGTVEKSGTGTLYVDAVSDSSADFTVFGGTLAIRSVKPTRAALPDGVYIHLDATDETALGKALKDDGVTYGLETWADCRGDGFPTATHSTTNLPTVSSATIAGKTMPVIDFGPVMTSSGSQLTTLKKATAMTFDNLSRARSMAIVLGSRQGGGVISGSSKNGNYGGLARKSYGANYSDAIFYTSDSYRVPRYIANGRNQNNLPGGAHWRLNGAEVQATATGLSGAFDLVTIRTPDAFGVNALSLNNWSYACGGQEIGEVIYWERMLTEDEMKQVEAYLREKWFGVARPAEYVGATVGNLTVAADATVRIEGGAPLAVKSISGGGTIEGSVVLGNDGDFVVPVAADGSTPTLTLESIDIGCAANLAFTGSVRKLTAGEHILVSAPSIRAGDTVGWSVSGLSDNRTCVLKAVDGALVADIGKMGALILIR